MTDNRMWICGHIYFCCCKWSFSVYRRADKNLSVMKLIMSEINLSQVMFLWRFITVLWNKIDWVVEKHVGDIFFQLDSTVNKIL